MNPIPVGFDLWTSFFAFSAIIGLTAAIRLFIQKPAHSASVWLGILVLLFSVSIAEWVLWWTGYIARLPQFVAFSRPYPFFFGVLLLGYYRAAFPGAENQAERHSVFLFSALKWHFVPGILYVIKWLPVLVRNWGIELHNWNQYTYFDNGIDAILYPMFAHLLIYPVLIHRAYLPLLKKDPNMAAWHRWIFSAFVAVGLAYVAHHLLTLLGWMSLKLDYLIAFFIVLFMGLVAWLGFIQPRILAGMSFLEAVLPLKYRKSALSNEGAFALAGRLQEMFEQEKIYLDPDLTLDILAKRTRLSRHHISQAVNAVFEMGFPEWLSQWRVEAAKALLASEKGRTMIIKEVAYESGFNSKAAFNAVFKKWTGMTPSEYRAGQNAEI